MKDERAANSLPIYSESQRFSPWLAIIIPLVAVSSTFFYRGHMFETQLLISAIAISFLYLCNLQTELREDAFYYRFFPFQLKRHSILRSEIAKIYVRKYSPLKEFGGWGIRWGRNGSNAFNTKGNMGVQIELTSGKSILFGTQKPEEWEKVIKEMFADS